MDYFQSQAGHEQAGGRPALVLSPVSYNRKVGLAVLCPITNQIKATRSSGNPAWLESYGAILADQVKNLDWKAREIKLICKLPSSVTDDALRKLNALLRV